MMLGTLKKWAEDNLGGGSPADLGKDDIELALAALLVELARADFRENPDEFAEIRQLLTGYLKPAAHIEELLAAAARRADRAVSLHEFTRQLNAEFTEEQKLGVVEMLWRVSLADGRIDAHEGHLVRKVAGLLHVRDRDLVRLRLKVEAEKASS
jgi:uncharacterized tellurite resistance protein B-like protein